MHAFSQYVFERTFLKTPCMHEFQVFFAQKLIFNSTFHELCEVLSYKLLHHYQNHSSNVLVLTRPNLDLPVFSLPHLHYAKWQSQLNTPQHPRLTWSYLAHFPFFLMPISWWAIGKDWRKLWKSLSKTNRHREKAPEPLSFVHQPVQVETEGLESSIHLGSGID